MRIVPALVLLCVAFGLRSGHAWSGYGGALFLAARWAGDLVAIERLDAARTPWASVAFVTALVGCVAYLLFRAGRALSGNGRGFKWGWIALATAVFVSALIFRPFVIPTGAMEDTLLIGDQLWVRVVGASTPPRGDVILFRNPMDVRQTFVKRCMGVPGDVSRQFPEPAQCARVRGRAGHACKSCIER